jgi:hypothetical protein
VDHYLYCHILPKKSCKALNVGKGSCKHLRKEKKTKGGRRTYCSQDQNQAEVLHVLYLKHEQQCFIRYKDIRGETEYL